MSPIKRSLADLPPGRDASGWATDGPPRFAHLLALSWHAEDREAGDRPHAIVGTRFRHSDAGACARRIAYKAAHIEATDEIDLCGTWNTRLGTLIHDLWQAELQRTYPDAQIEVTSQVMEDGSGSMDALVRVSPSAWPGGAGDRLVSIELKTVGGYAMKAAIGKIRRGTPAEGPKSEHVIQGALNAMAHRADELVIAYLAKETLSKGYSEVPDAERFCAEWTLTREQYEPIAQLEIERIEGILNLLDTGLLASRKVPGIPGEIVDPATSRWEVKDSEGMILDTGSAWGGQMCLYCSHLGLCDQLPSGRVDVDFAIATREAMS